MGREVVKLCEANYRGASLAFGVDPQGGYDGIPVFQSLDEIITTNGVDCIIDFSHHSVTPALLDFAIAKELPLVLCTTGHSDEEIALIHKAAESIPLFYSGNMSLGVALLVELAKTAAMALPEAEIEIIEKHHNRKVDAPSGTALALAESINEGMDNAYSFTFDRSRRLEKRRPKEIGISAVRGGNIPGTHEVIFAGPDEVIEFNHIAYSRSIFGKGALAAAKFLAGKGPGLYTMADVIG
jgi:4-hydroxy-tetrahydrodipicolinate reductase